MQPLKMESRTLLWPPRAHIFPSPKRPRGRPPTDSGSKRNSEAEAYKGSRCHRCWGDNEPSWSPSLTLFEVARFLAAKAIRLSTSRCRRFAANATFFDLTHGSRRGLGAVVATRLTNSTTSKLTLRARNALLCVFVLLLAGCGSRNSGTQSVQSPSEKSPATQRTLVDDLDRTVVLPSRVERVVSLSPAGTETLFAIGAGKMVVGVTKFADFPPEVASLPRVGGFVTESLSVERIVELKPDLVISAGSLQIGIVEQLEKLGVPTIAFEPNSLDSIGSTIRRIGVAVGMAADGERVADELMQRIAAIEKKVDGVDKLTVYYEVAHKPMMAAGPKSFIGELLNRAGGRNIFSGTGEQYPFINPEEVIRRSPQVILVPNRPGAVDRVLSRDGWAGVDAVRDRRVVTINEDTISRAGPRIADGLELVARAIHPERFP